MEKLEQLKQIHESYEKFEGEVVTGRKEAFDFIYSLYRDARKYSESLEEQKKENLRKRKYSSILVNIPFVTIHKDPHFYDMDNNDIDLERRICADFLGYYCRFSSGVFSDNYAEVVRLGAFCKNYCDADLEKLEASRIQREDACYGIGEVKKYTLTDREVFGEFVNHIVDSLCAVERVEMVKK